MNASEKKEQEARIKARKEASNKQINLILENEKFTELSLGTNFRYSTNFFFIC